MINVYEQVDRNKRKSFFVVLVFVVFIVIASYFFARMSGGGWGTVGIALIISGLMSFVSYYFSDKIILSISNARPADKRTDFNFFTVAENLSMAGQIPLPKLFVIDDSAPNAFATGRDPEHAVIVATTGLLSKLNRTELEGVVAHELSHVRNYDSRLMSIVVVLVGVITLLADWLMRGMFRGRRNDDDNRGQAGAILFVISIVLMLLSPIIAQLIQLAISRKREFLADASAVLLTRYPDGLASALEKISQDPDPLEVANKATAHLYIINPLKNRHDSIGMFANLFNTHPPIEERIAVLRGMK